MLLKHCSICTENRTIDWLILRQEFITRPISQVSRGGFLNLLFKILGSLGESSWIDLKLWNKWIYGRKDIKWKKEVEISLEIWKSFEKNGGESDCFSDGIIRSSIRKPNNPSVEDELDQFNSIFNQM